MHSKSQNLYFNISIHGCGLFQKNYWNVVLQNTLKVITTIIVGKYTQYTVNCMHIKSYQMHRWMVPNILFIDLWCIVVCPDVSIQFPYDTKLVRFLVMKS